jgi:hypothetical protein
MLKKKAERIVINGFYSLIIRKKSKNKEQSRLVKSSSIFILKSNNEIYLGLSYLDDFCEATRFIFQSCL